MKQLHRQSSISKQHRPHHHRTSLSRTLASYLLREQRLLFVLLGFLLASSFFFLYPHSAAGSSSATNITAAFARKNPRSSGASSSARRLPVGVRKPSLRIVVTGGAGFVGSHLVDKLLARGDSVIVVDNFFTGRKDNVAHHLGNPRFELIRHDVVEPILLEVDQIYHLACPASPVHYKFNPIKTIISSPLRCPRIIRPHPHRNWIRYICLYWFIYGHGYDFCDAHFTWG
ncbi:UDP-glucuronic acid decarboxylase 4 [Zea mays]|jgi:UDP-glucuronate decarboxylase|uniref:UDP-glucuronic acid decarboxylase 4 n=1 Tax=Zea mays TaxID=4577 RepID=K7VJC9_MAIZE|nr:UDP-glucuronic acid decarboxylase 4 [Zea mays]